MPQYSTAMQAHLQGVNRADPEVILLEIAHADLGTPVRVCNDAQDLTHNGNLFVAMPFAFTLPDDGGEQPRAQLVMSNLGRELMAALEAANGGVGATLRARVVRRSVPNTAELDFTVALQTVTADATTITAELGFDFMLDWPAIAMRYDQVSAPGIF